LRVTGSLKIKKQTQLFKGGMKKKKTTVYGWKKNKASTDKCW